MQKLAGKVAIVTGASKGIGAAIAQQLARDGAEVIVNYSSSAKQAEEVAAGIRSTGGSAKPVQADVSKPSEARRLAAAAVAEFGRLDILVNNAGVYGFLPLSKITEEHFDWIFNLNVRGLLFATQAATEAMDRHGGSVVNISSVASLSAPPEGSVYSASKGAVDVITRSLAAELGPRNILVNAVLPGPVDTEGVRSIEGSDQMMAAFVARTPLGRIGKPDDIATVVSFLVSPEARWITGQIIQVAGGLR